MVFVACVRVRHFNYLLRVWPAFWPVGAHGHLAAAAHDVDSARRAVDRVRGSFAYECRSDSMKNCVCVLRCHFDGSFA